MNDSGDASAQFGSAGASPSQPLPQRQRPAHGVHPELNRPTIVFLTVCTKNRTTWLASPAVHDLLCEIWTAADAWLVGRYVLKPDHIHLFAAPGRIDLPFDNWVRYWKSQFTKRHQTPDHQWHPDHWDRRLRNDEGYAQKWEYTHNNPIRHGLVANADLWPYQGELNQLEW